MYAEFFGLRELPFNNTPDPRFFFSTPDHEEAVASLIYAVQERKGFVLLTGEVGAGKTLVSRMMLKHFAAQITFASIHHAVQGAGDLLEALCSEFELPVETDASHNKLVHTLHDYLLAEFAKDTPVVLVLDEAQALSVDAFEQLRMIGNLEADDAKLLQVVILGQPELQKRFSSPEFHQLRQRIFRTFHLPALSRDLTEEYIRHRLTIAGAPHTDFFDRPALDKIYKYSNGLPRLINTICDNAMLSAYSANCRRMDAEFIETSVTHMMSLGEDDRSFTQDDTKTTECKFGSSTFGRTAGMSHNRETALESDQAGTVISLLSRRIAELEGFLDRSRYGAPPATESVTASNDIQHLETLKQDVHRVAQEISRKASEVNGQLVGMTRNLRGAPAIVAQAQTATARLESLVRQAAELSKQVHVECVSREKEEARLNRMAVTTRAVVVEVRRIFDGLKRAATRTQIAEKRAQTVCDRLATMCDAADRQWHGAEDFSLRGRALSITARKSAQVPQSGIAVRQGLPDGPEGYPVAVTQKTLPASAVNAGHGDLPLHGDDRTFQEALSRSRSSLAELRTVVRQASDERAVATVVDRQLAEGVGEDSVLRPTLRLATQVERLLQTVSQAD